MVAYYVVYKNSQLDGPFFDYFGACEFAAIFKAPLILCVIPKIVMHKCDWPLHTVEQDD